MATHSSFLAWKSAWIEEPLVGSQSMGHKESDTPERARTLSKLCCSIWWEY